MKCDERMAVRAVMMYGLETVAPESFFRDPDKMSKETRASKSKFNGWEHCRTCTATLQPYIEYIFSPRQSKQMTVLHSPGASKKGTYLKEKLVVHPFT